MKKLVLVLMMALMVLFLFSSCAVVESLKEGFEESYESDDDDDDEDDQDDDDDEDDDDDKDHDKDSDDDQDGNNGKDSDNGKDGNDEGQDSDGPSNGGFHGDNVIIIPDESLTGMALLESSTYSDAYEYWNFEAEYIDIYFDFEGNEMVSTSHEISFEDNYRLESETSGLKTITIYIGDEDATYTYAEDGSFAYVTYGDEDYDNEDFLDYEEGDMTLAEFVFESAELADAYVTNYNGESTVYIEMTASYSENVSTIQMWLSIANGSTLKMDYLIDGELSSSTEYLSYEFIDGVPASTFDVPADIDFEDYSSGYDDFDIGDIEGIDLDDIDLDDLGLDDIDLGDLDLGDIDLGDINLDDIDLGDLDLGDLDLGDIDLGDLNLDGSSQGN